MLDFMKKREDDKPSNLMQKLQAILFISEQPLTLEDFSESLGIGAEEIRMALFDLEEFLKCDKSAIELRELADGFQLFTKREYFGACEGFLLDQNKRKLSASAVETLAIVAYTQPVTRAQIAEIRGVNSDTIVATLINKGYVFESGISEDVGNPALLSTTTKFLDAFGFNSIYDLPPLENFAPDEDARIAIAERLGALNSRNTGTPEQADFPNP